MNTVKSIADRFMRRFARAQRADQMSSRKSVLTQIGEAKTEQELQDIRFKHLDSAASPRTRLRWERAHRARLRQLQSQA